MSSITNQPKHILVVEDDAALATSLHLHLSKQGFAVTAVLDGLRALKEARRQVYDLILLDVMLPGLDGLRICGRLRQEGVETPVLMLTSKHHTDDVCGGLECGADGYMIKPFSYKELTARVQALLMRPPKGGRMLLPAGTITLDKSAKCVLTPSGPLSLRPKEWDVLAVIVQAAGSLVSREQISRRTADRFHEMSNKAVDVHISNLRKALTKHGAGGVIESVYRLGYRLRQT